MELEDVDVAMNQGRAWSTKITVSTRRVVGACDSLLVARDGVCSSEGR